MPFRLFVCLAWVGILCATFTPSTVAQNPWQLTPGEAHLQPVELPEIGPCKITRWHQRIPLSTLCEPGVACGGGGRFLVLHLREPGQLAIFDLVEGSIVGRLNLRSNNIAFAASANKLVVVDCETRTIHRYDLLTLRKEQSGNIEINGVPGLVRIGYASNGPVFVVAGNGDTAEHQLLDLGTLQPATIAAPELPWSPEGGNDGCFHISGNGELIALTKPNPAPRGIQCLHIKGNQSELLSGEEYAGLLIPGPFGVHVYTSQGPCSIEIKRVSQNTLPAIPSIGSPLYLTRSANDQSAIEIHNSFDAGAAVSIPGILTDNLSSDFANGMANVESLNVFFVPAANVIAVIPDQRDAIVLHKFNLKFQSRQGNAAIGLTPLVKTTMEQTSSRERQSDRPPDNMTVVMLPGVISDAVIAGSGRYILLALRDRKQIGVYDATTMTIARYLDIGSRDFLVAGGANNLFVAERDKKTISRWSMATWTKELTRDLPFSGTPVAIATGFDCSRGPILVNWNGDGPDATSRFGVIDPESLELNPEYGEFTTNYVGTRADFHLRASGTGRVFGGWCTKRVPQGAHVFRLTDDRIRHSRVQDSKGHICPNQNGNVLVSAAGVFNTKIAALKARPDQNHLLVPTTHPDFYVSIPKPQIDAPESTPSPKRNTVSVHAIDSGAKLASLAVGEVGRSRYGEYQYSDFSIDKRVLFLFQQGQLVTVPYRNDQLQVVPFDLAESLDQFDEPFLTVLSIPPGSCIPGKTFHYPINVVSSADRYDFELSAGPDGMALSDTGEISWDVPPTFEGLETVIVTVTAGEEMTYHTFELRAE